MKKKYWIVSVLCVVAVMVLSGGIYLTWLLTPPPMPESMDDVKALLTSARFQRLPDDRKLAYVSRINEMMEGMDDQRRGALWGEMRDDPALREAAREVRWQFMIARARDFAMADEATRNAMLDRLIAMMEARGGWGRNRDRGQEESTPEQQAKREQRRERMLDRMGQNAQTGNPQHTAYIGEFFKALNNRRTELGLPRMGD